jgi:hypothetical protein
MEPTFWENTLLEDRRQGGGGTAHVDVRRVTTHSIHLRSIDVILVNRLFLYTLFHLLQGELGSVILVLRQKGKAPTSRPPKHQLVDLAPHTLNRRGQRGLNCHSTPYRTSKRRAS